MCPPSYKLNQLVNYALYLGTFGFGGPVALVGYMHRDLVEQRKWISETEYKEGLTLAQLMPGPLAAQLAIYLGYVHYGILGASIVGTAFVLPSFLMVLTLGWAYVQFGGIAWMQAVFYGVGASVIGIISISAYKLSLKTLGNHKLLWGIYLLSAVATIITESENVLLFLVSGFLVFVTAALPPKGSTTASIALPPVTILASSKASLTELLTQIALFFTKAGSFVFGSGLAIVPFLYGGVVKEYGWLNDQEFLDAVAVAMITPGPVVITVGFIGYIVAAKDGDFGFAGGFLGATVAALATFLPCYLFTILPAPYFKKHGKRPGIVAFVDGVTAAAVGAIAGSCVVLGRRTVFSASWQPEWPKIILLLLTIVVLLRFKKLPEPVIVLVAAIVGLLIFPLVR